MGKYEVRMKVTFYNEGNIVKGFTLIDVLEAVDIISALKDTETLLEDIHGEFVAFVDEEKGCNRYDEFTNFRDVDEVEVTISAIVPFK